MTLSNRSSGLLVSLLAGTAICCNRTPSLGTGENGEKGVREHGQSSNNADAGQVGNADGNWKTSFQQQLEEEAAPRLLGDVLDEGGGAVDLLRSATPEKLDEAIQLAMSLSKSKCWSHGDQSAAGIIGALEIVDKQRAIRVSDSLLDAEETECATRGAAARVLVNSRGKAMLERLVRALERRPEQFEFLTDSIQKSAGACGDPSFARVAAALERFEKSTDDWNRSKIAAREREWFERQIKQHTKADAGSGQ